MCPLGLVNSLSVIYGKDVSMESGGSVISTCGEQFQVDLWWEVA